ncbi:SPOR domain-containing protein, partial [bacterium]|nr:SPOR domain-containing protein [bacterium]
DPGFQEKLSDPGRPGVAQGYRVQIFLGDDLREASRMMADARSKFEEQVYLEYDAPYYKVRVGDCQTESDGEKLLKIARRFGYQEAWLVYTVISVPEEPDRR